MGIVPYHICTSDYNCLTCEFDQMMREKMASGETPELDVALERFKELPGHQRLCAKKSIGLKHSEVSLGSKQKRSLHR